MTLVFCGFGLAILQMPLGFAAESSQELSTLSVEVQALKARQLVIQADLKSIRELLASSLQGSVEETSKTEVAKAPAAAPVTDTSKELAALRKTVATYKANELKARSARLPVRDIDFTLDVSNDPTKGSEDAVITLVEFTDFECPFCARHNKDVMPKILKNYVDTGKIRYVLRDYPLAFHKNALKAHEAAQCARDQDKYWEMHEQLFANQRALMKENLAGYAETAGVADIAAFQSCLDSDRFAESTKRSLAEGVKAGVTGTPSFLLGITEAGSSKLKTTKFIRGAQPYEVFEDALAALLSPEKEDK